MTQSPTKKKTHTKNLNYISRIKKKIGHDTVSHVFKTSYFYVCKSSGVTKI